MIEDRTITNELFPGSSGYCSFEIWDHDRWSEQVEATGTGDFEGDLSFIDSYHTFVPSFPSEASLELECSLPGAAVLSVVLNMFLHHESGVLAGKAEPFRPLMGEKGVEVVTRHHTRRRKLT